MHIVITVDAQSAGNRFVVYADNIEIHSVALTRSLPPASTVREHHYVAKSRWPNNGYLDGDIASLHFWNRALS